MEAITKRLPAELVRYIKEYIPKKEFVFTNTINYNLYHNLIKPSIKDHESYIRAMIRQDNDFVFKKIVEENYTKWYEIRQYKYKNMIFNNYLYFVMNFCIENDSNNCRKIISDFLKEHGLGKNLHKKNVVKYIKWKN
jgi:phosphoribosyl-ATP pyrophosphohydrolase